MVIHYPRGQSDLTIPLKLCSAKHQIYLHLNDSKSDISVLSVLIDNINQITPLAGWLTFKWGKKPSSRSVNKTFTEIYSALYWGATWWHWREQCRERWPLEPIKGHNCWGHVWKTYKQKPTPPGLTYTLVYILPAVFRVRPLLLKHCYDAFQRRLLFSSMPRLECQAN